MGNDGVINDTIPMPCSSEDNEDIPYLKKIFEFIESNPNQFDSSRIYAEGFSQNSVFSAYLGFCFNDKVIGISQGGGGLAKSGQRPFFPGCEGHVRWSDHLYCNQNHINCADCIKERPCKECQYWPIYPCYSSKRPMVNCIVEYTNDPVSVQQDHSSALYMYEKMTEEGHDPRVFRFSPNDNIEGGHSAPQNHQYWQVGCLGIAPVCSKVRTKRYY